MNIYSIYKATNLINHKVYIGFDSAWPMRRATHMRNVKSGFFSNLVLYKAIKKHGWENFSWEVIYQSREHDHTLKVMETYFINEYQSYVWLPGSCGYNMTLGGEGTLGRKHTTETINKLRGQVRTEEQKAKMRGAFTEEHASKIQATRFGRVVTEETRTKMRNAQLGVKRQPNSAEHNAKIKAAYWARHSTVI